MAEGRFELIDILGAGAFALVCTAVDRQTGGTVALKVLRSSVRDDAGAVARLRDEGRILSLLDHPNIARCLEVVEYPTWPVLVIELVEGVSLDAIVQNRGMLPPWVALAIGLRVARALAFAWEAPGRDGSPLRIVHRDLKPNNVLIATSGAVKVVDFGIAKGAFAERQAKSLFVVQGTAGYDAPERSESREDGPAVDVYGLGALLLTMLTGETPLIPRKGDQRGPILDRLLEGQPRAATELVRSMLAPRAAERPEMAQVVSELEGQVGDRGIEEWAAERVPELLDGRRFRSSLVEEGWEDLAFLERDEPTAEVQVTPAIAAARVRELVSTPGWEKRVVEIEAILARTERFTPKPLVDVLRRARVPWFRPWQRAATPAELEAALLVLCDRADAVVVELAGQLMDHGDDRVKAAARFLVSQRG